jgi:hypothetical protein
MSVDGWISTEKHFLMIQILYQHSRVFGVILGQTKSMENEDVVI